MAKVSLEDALLQAKSFELDGDIESARALYRSVLAAFPGNARAQQALSGLDRQQPPANAAPSVPQQEIGNLVNLYRSGNFEIVIGSAENLIKIYGESFIIWNIMGAARGKIGDIEGSIFCYMSAIRLNSEFFEAHNNLGAARKSQGRLNEAIDSYRRALAIKPDFSAAHYNMGTALIAQGKFNEAILSFRRALEIKPDYADAHNNLGAALKELRRPDEALGSYNEAVRLNPSYAVAFRNRGNALLEMSRRREALESYDEAIRLDPERPLFRLSRALGILPTTPIDEVEALHAVHEIDQLIEKFEKWLDEKQSRSDELRAHIGSVQPFYIAYRSGNHINILSKYGNIITKSANKKMKNYSIELTSENRKIKILILSGYFHRHSVWDIIIKGILLHIDRSKFEIHLFHIGKTEDQETRWARSRADSWCDARQISGAEAWIAAIQEAKPDIIFYPEIGMDPTTVFLAAHRLAPLQVVGWGHPITTGLETMDCFVSGELIEGADASSHYRETLIQLPGTGCCTIPIEVDANKLKSVDKHVHGLSPPYFVLPHGAFKFDPVDDDIFPQIAARLGQCSFLFVEFQGQNAQMRCLIERIGRAFRDRGLDPSRFIRAIPYLERAEFFSLLDSCDVYLDCPGFSGYTTAWQAVHRGLPIVTLEGEFMRQRLAAGLLRQIGQADTIASTTPEYVDIAVRLGLEASDAARFAKRREALQRAAPAADHRIEVVRAFEANLLEQLSLRQPRRQGTGLVDMP